MNNMYGDICNIDYVNITEVHFQYLIAQAQSGAYNSFDGTYTVWSLHSTLNFLASIFGKWIENVVGFVGR